jgi:hypothetical protein
VHQGDIDHHILLQPVGEGHDGGEDHGGGADYRGTDEHGLGSGFEGVAGTIVFFQVLLGLLEVGFETEVLLQVGLNHFPILLRAFRPILA